MRSRSGARNLAFFGVGGDRGPVVGMAVGFVRGDGEGVPVAHQGGIEVLEGLW